MSIFSTNEYGTTLGVDRIVAVLHTRGLFESAHRPRGGSVNICGVASHIRRKRSQLVPHSSGKEVVFSQY